MKKKKIMIAVVIILLIAIASVCFIPKVRVSLFVHSYHELIEEALADGNGVPADDAVFFGYDAVNSWEGTHPMTEFVIMSFGDKHYGCYYSPDDKPLAFQNVDTELSQDGHSYWEWRVDDSIFGSTSKIMDKWYYFEASYGNAQGGNIKLSDNIESIKVEYLGGGKIIRWSLSQERIAEMKEWVADLEYEEIRFQEGMSPADGEGQAVYSLEFSDGTEFAYYDCGTEHYIRKAELWYRVRFPQLPPVGEPDNLEAE